MRVCHCVGYMNNPGGKCCRDLAPTERVTKTGKAVPSAEEARESRLRELGLRPVD